MIPTERFAQVELRSAAELRAWLLAHHAQADSVWLVTWKKKPNAPFVSVGEVLDEVIVFGWIDGRTSTKLRPARDEAPAGAKNAEAQKGKRREHDSHCIVNRRGLPTEAGGELREQRRAYTNDDSQTQHLDAGGDHIAQHPLGHEGCLAEKVERDQHESSKRGQLELDQRHEELPSEDEKGQQHENPGEHQAGNLDEVLEESYEAHQIRDGLMERPPGIETRLCVPAGT